MKLKSYMFFATLTISLLPAYLMAATPVQGGLYTNTTWTKAKSPYLVTGNMVIFDDVKLKIEPGVIVKFAQGTGIEVRGGSIFAQGTLKDSIYFIKDEAASSWQGFIIKQLKYIREHNLNFRFVSVSNATILIDMKKDYYSKATLSRSKFSYNDTVFVKAPYNIQHEQYHIYDSLLIVHNNIVSFRTNPQLTNSIIANNNKGFYDMANLFRFYNNVFKDNKEAAIQGLNLFITKCRFENNGIGLLYFSKGSLGRVDVDSNVFFNNDIAIVVTGDKLYLTNNKICNSKIYNIKMEAETTIEAVENCWCTNDSAAIRASLYDGYVDLSKGLVRYTPFISCDPIITDVSMQDYKTISTVESIYPNPASNQIAIRAHFSGVPEVQMINLSGEIVAKLKVNDLHIQSGTIPDFDISLFQDGVYYIKLQNNSSAKKIKFVVLK